VAKRKQAPRHPLSGTPESPWRGNGGAREGAGKPPGTLDLRTKAFAVARQELSDLIRKKVDPGPLINVYHLRALNGDLRAAEFLFEYGWPKPKEMEEFDFQALFSGAVVKCKFPDSPSSGTRGSASLPLPEGAGGDGRPGPGDPQRNGPR
jgi:hypothetical protein